MFEIRVKTGIDWDKKVGVVSIADLEYEYCINKEYPVDVKQVETDGVTYLDSLFKECIVNAVDTLIANRVEFRKDIINVYDAYDLLKEDTDVKKTI